MSLQIQHAKRKEKSIMANLLQLYCHDLSDIVKIDVDADGLFKYSRFDDYWEDENRMPLLFRQNDKIVGFALINRYSFLDAKFKGYSIAEFFVLKKYRRNGLGMDAVRRILSIKNTSWEISVIEKYEEAQKFWNQVFAHKLGFKVSKERIQVDKLERIVYKLEPLN